MTDFRALCTELLEIVEDEYSGTSCLLELRRSARAALAEAYEAEANNPPEGHPDPEPFQAILRERAAALAQPEPVGATDEELTCAAEEAGFCYESNGHIFNSRYEGYDIKPEVLSFARAVLARWGRPAVEPVPVSEGLPKRKDCDAEGKCWWAANDGIYDHWRKLDLDKALNNPWRPTHWLPYHALPTPNQEAGQ